MASLIAKSLLLIKNYHPIISSLEVVLKTIFLNLSFTIKTYLFSLTVSTIEFYKGIKDIFFSFLTIKVHFAFDL